MLKKENTMSDRNSENSQNAGFGSNVGIFR